MPRECPKFMHSYVLLPQKIIDAYGLAKKVHNGWVCVLIKKGIYGLPQAGLLANNFLVGCLVAAGYNQCQFTPGRWCHKWHLVTFSLVVDNFGMKTVGLMHATNLKETLQKV
ncbi:hypothetical protein ACHAW6_011439 [Cyclotella cf. meneghiniana]